MLFHNNNKNLNKVQKENIKNKYKKEIDNSVYSNGN